ncbi:lysozyme [Salipiger bermudensis]|uniref:lysozyme n=1 Tax=Salipiger bermudensis TaxID=344736 RepID=UPI001C99FEBE|nr:lysozyme [Salipiger bermudensis]MBY6005364.1 lysozyme [Salipiger bermudensis]
MQITARVAAEVAAHEGLVRQAYKDSVAVWTWSIGITAAIGHEVSRYINNPQPMKRCLEVWVWVLEKYADDVLRAFSGHELTEAQFAAALSFHYNTGAIGRASWVERWKAGDIAGARKAFMNWKKPAEIIPRRQAERDLFFNGKWSGDGHVTEYTRVTASYTPVWSSAQRVDIRPALAEIYDAPAAAKPVTPPATSGAFAAIISALLSIFRKDKA